MTKRNETRDRSQSPSKLQIFSVHHGYSASALLVSPGGLAKAGVQIPLMPLGASGAHIRSHRLLRVRPTYMHPVTCRNAHVNLGCSDGPCTPVLQNSAMTLLHQTRCALGRRRQVAHFHVSPAWWATRKVLQRFKLADIGEGITECEVIKWYVSPERQPCTILFSLHVLRSIELQKFYIGVPGET